MAAPAHQISLAIPVLETERLVLREPREADFPAMLAFNDSPRSGFVGNFANSSLVTINFERPFSETPMVKAVLHSQDTVPRIIYTQNQTNTGFQIATNYAASLIGVWYEASVLNTNKSA